MQLGLRKNTVSLTLLFLLTIKTKKMNLKNKWYKIQ